MARAVASCCAELSIPIGRAPARADHADTYAVPQPSSIRSLPARFAGRNGRSVCGIDQVPQRGSPAHCCLARAPYHSLKTVSHTSRLSAHMVRQVVGVLTIHVVTKPRRGP